jgi:lipopolysaccharide biosynthesis regulator YciM
MIEFLALLLPVAAASGWWVARRANQKDIRKLESSQLDSAYFRGLNYLVNEQPDKAIDVFVRMLEVNSETVEMHLALGGLFRRKGEVDRAIRIHQNLIARPTLSSEQRAQALLSLGEDYLSAGLLDRAEALFEELVENNNFVQPALGNLKIIYQHEKDWQKTLSISQRLKKLGNRQQDGDQAHYLCELAGQSLKEEDEQSALDYLEQALEVDREAFRPLMMKAQLAMQHGRFDKAISLYKKIVTLHPAYVGEVLEPLSTCFSATGNKKQWISWLQDVYGQKKNLHVMLALAKYFERNQSTAAAIDFLTREMAASPRLAGVQQLIALRKQQAGQGQHADFLEVVNQLVERLIKEQAAYQCHHCGFTTRTLHWQCPGCRSWGTMLPNDSTRSQR